MTSKDPRLTLQTTASGKKRWAKGTLQVPEPTKARTDWPHRTPAHEIVRDHARQLDYVLSHADKAGRQDPEKAQAMKDGYLQTLGHMLNHADGNQIEHLRRLAIVPWKGKNDAIYSPVHHALQVGDKLSHGDSDHLAPHPSAPLIHELLHAMDLTAGGRQSRAGMDIDAAIGKKGIPPKLATPLKPALRDPREWLPRLGELALTSPEHFHDQAAHLKEHGIDAYKTLKQHACLDIPKPKADKATKDSK